MEGECYGGRWLHGGLSTAPGVVANAVVVVVVCLVPVLVIVAVVVGKARCGTNLMWWWMRPWW